MNIKSKIVNFKNRNLPLINFSEARLLGNPLKGFTLIELLIVVAIIGVLATLVMANLSGVRQKSRDTLRKSDLRQIQAALELYRSDQASYPPSPLPSCGSALSVGTTTYIQKVPCDPMNTGQHVYTYISTGTSYSLIACLENTNDLQKDTANNATYCAGGGTNWSFTLNNP